MLTLRRLAPHLGTNLLLESTSIVAHLLPHGESSKLAEGVWVAKVYRPRDVARDGVGTVPVLWVKGAFSADGIWSSEKNELDVEAVLAELLGQSGAEISPAGFGSIIDPDPVHWDTVTTPEVDALLAGEDEWVLLLAELVFQSVFICHDDDGTDDVKVFTRILKDVAHEIEVALMRGVE